LQFLQVQGLQRQPPPGAVLPQLQLQAGAFFSTVFSIVLLRLREALIRIA